MKEEWKDVVGYDGIYKISSNGNLKSVDRTVNGKLNSTHFVAGKTMTQQKSKKGYKVIILHKGGIAKCKQIHRLVCEAFLENEKNLPQVNHKDLNKENNSVENLEWITNADNMKHAIKNGAYGKHTKLQDITARKNAMKASMSRRKRVIQMDLNNNEIARFDSIVGAEKETKIQNSKICACCKKKRKTAGGYIWKYESEVI